MIGLIRKDVYCLKKNLVMFFGVTFGVLFVAILFILSFKYGNIKYGMEEFSKEIGISYEQTMEMMKIVIWVVLFIPVAFISMIVECFKEDKKASFKKKLFSLPISNKQIVGSRYLSCLVFLIISMLVSMFAAILIAITSDVYTFGSLIGCVISFGAILLAYMGIVMFLLYVFGADKADLIQCVPFLVIFIVIEVMMIKEMNSIKGGSDIEIMNLLINIIKKTSNIMVDKWFVLIIGSLIIFALSYIGACISFNKRREVL